MAKERDVDGGSDLIKVGGVVIGKDLARQLVTEMSGGAVWPFIMHVLEESTKITAERVLTDASMQFDHTEELFRAQGETMLASQLSNLRNELTEALSSED